jgi:hypothetical protein
VQCLYSYIVFLFVPKDSQIALCLQNFVIIHTFHLNIQKSEPGKGFICGTLRISVCYCLTQPALTNDVTLGPHPIY